MIRHVVLGAVAGGIVLLSPYQTAAAPLAPLQAAGMAIAVGAAAAQTPAPLSASGAASPLYAVDNPAQPGDAFPNSAYSGGTD